MSFNLDEWSAQVKGRLQQWAQQPRETLGQAGARTLFGTLAAMTLFPLAQALARGDSMTVGLTLGGIAAGVGANLVAEQVQRWKDLSDGTDAVPDLEAALATSQELRQAVDAILDELDVVHQAHEALPRDDRAWLVEQLRAELDAYPGGLERTTAAVGDIYQKITVKGGTVGAIGGRGHTIKYVEREEHHHYPSPAPSLSPSPPDPRRAYHAYLTHVVDHTQHLRLQGIRSAGELVTVDLEEIYITLDAVQKRAMAPEEMEAELARLAGHVPGDKAWPGVSERTGELREREVEVVLSVNEALAEHVRLVVLGAPGCGKTTFLHYLALTYARDQRGDRAGLVGRRLGLDGARERRLPILLPLRDFARHLAKTQEDAGLDGPRFLLDYLADYFAAQEVALPPGFFRRALEAGAAAVLLDGLDEVADPELRRRVARIVEAFTRRYPKNRFVVTSRLVGYQGASRLGEDYFCATVRDFDRAAMARFVHNWSLAVEVALAGRRSPTIERRAAEQASSLLAAVEGNPRVRELAVNPLLLTVIALVHRYRVRLPERRAELYEECVEVLLGYWDEARGVRGYALPGLDLDAGDKRSLLEPVAFWMQERELRGGEVIKAVHDQQGPGTAHIRRPFLQRFHGEPAQPGAVGRAIVEAVVLVRPVGVAQGEARAERLAKVDVAAQAEGRRAGAVVGAVAARDVEPGIVAMGGGKPQPGRRAPPGQRQIAAPAAVRPPLGPRRTGDAGLGRAFRGDRDDAADRVRAEQRRLRAAQHLYPVDVGGQQPSRILRPPVKPTVPSTTMILRWFRRLA